ncbi:MAG: hypothetical protein ACI93T_001436 [Porticoccaceae bacterium]|jgi:hypothetical protein
MLQYQPRMVRLCDPGIKAGGVDRFPLANQTNLKTKAADFSIERSAAGSMFENQLSFV